MNPSGVLKVASLPFRRDLDKRRFLFLYDPVVEEFLPFLGLQHGFDSLEIVGQVSPVYIGLFLEHDDGADLAVLLLVHHNERLRYIAFIHVIYLFGDLRREVLILEPTAARIGVDHQSGIHHGVLVFRETYHGLLELDTICQDELTNTVEPLDGVHFVRCADTGPE